jgi:hypothetical protein
VARPSVRSGQRIYRRMGRPIAAALAPALAKPAAKRGFREARLLAEWPAVVGEQLASRTRPERLDRRGGVPTLRLLVAPGWATEVQHMAPRITQRINQYFGQAMVERLALRQGPIPPRKPSRVPPRQPSPARDIPDEQLARLEADCAQVADPELGAILRRLGETLLRHPKTRA